MLPVPVPLPESVSVSFSVLLTPRIVKSPSTSKSLGPVCSIFVDLNVINGFRVPVVSGFYVLAIGLLCLHLRHGLWSMFQTLGFHHPRYLRGFKTAAAVIAIAIFLGFVSIPIAVLFRIIPEIV